MLKPVAVFPGPDAQERRARHVRSHDAGRQDAASSTPARPSPTTPAPGSASSRNTSSTRTAARSASRRPAFRRRRAHTTPASATRTSATIAREIVEKHLDLCLDAGINHEGINAEVAKGQWEFQIFGKGSKNAADQMWVARYIMMRLCEKYGVDVDWHCKPLGDTDWNGSGMHANFSTEYMRESRRQGILRGAHGRFDKYMMEHIAVYGPDNHLRLTGLHETSRRTSSTTASPTAARRSASRTASSTTATRATSKIAVRTRRATRTRSPRGPEDDLRRADRRQGFGRSLNPTRSAQKRGAPQGAPFFISGSRPSVEQSGHARQPQHDSAGTRCKASPTSWIAITDTSPDRRPPW